MQTQRQGCNTPPTLPGTRTQEGRRWPLVCAGLCPAHFCGCKFSEPQWQEGKGAPDPPSLLLAALGALVCSPGMLITIY